MLLTCHFALFHCNIRLILTPGFQRYLTYITSSYAGCAESTCQCQIGDVDVHSVRKAATETSATALYTARETWPMHNFVAVVTYVSVTKQYNLVPAKAGK